MPTLTDPTRLLIAGDTHASTVHIHFLCERALENNCQAILHLGDFGYWPNTGFGQTFLKVARRSLTNAGLDLFFLEGNHEDLQALFDPRHPDVGPFRLIARPLRNASAGAIFHISRGTRWSWSGVRFLAVGGGYSIDKDVRTPGRDWFEEETLSEGELAAILDDGQEIDVLASHDCPYGVAHGLPLVDTPESRVHQQALTLICERLHPALVLHGHLHHAYVTRHQATFAAKVIGLDCNLYPDASWVVLDLAQIKASLLPP